MCNGCNQLDAIAKSSKLLSDKKEKDAIIDRWHSGGCGR
jgi:hypothetical protein